jgi:hypothetical protein
LLEMQYTSILLRFSMKKRIDFKSTVQCTELLCKAYIFLRDFCAEGNWCMPKVARVVTKMHTNAIPTFLQIKVV